MMARIEREQKEAEARMNSRDDISEESKSMELEQQQSQPDTISEISEESKIQDLGQNQQMVNTGMAGNDDDDDDDLPGMVNRHLNINLD